MVHAYRLAACRCGGQNTLFIKSKMFIILKNIIRKLHGALNLWCWIQLVLMLFLSVICLEILQLLTSWINPIFTVIRAFVFLSVYAYTELMDRNPYAILWEVNKGCFWGIAISLQPGRLVRLASQYSHAFG